MRCSTCGETLFDGEDRCPTCGAALPRRRTSVVQDRVRQCPRCGHRGEPIPYFQKPGHMALLVGISIPTYGLGGLIYYASRRAYRICPGCGFGWEHSRKPEEAGGGWGRPPARVPAKRRQAPAPPDAPLPPSGIGRRIFGGALAVLGTVLITVGISTQLPETIMAGSIFGMAGSATFLWGWKSLQERRQAVIQSLNRKVLRLATERAGVLTVTDVAAALNLTLPAAEKIMIGMDDGFRVRSEISKEGVLYYEFPEVMHQKKLRSGDDG